jgi:hypothetical protein
VNPESAADRKNLNIYIYDKNSTDGIAKVAEEAGASVILGQRYGRISKHRALSADRLRMDFTNKKRGVFTPRSNLS